MIAVPNSLHGLLGLKDEVPNVEAFVGVSNVDQMVGDAEPFTGAGFGRTDVETTVNLDRIDRNHLKPRRKVFG